ncbi:MAG: CHRD domain-containing protein, partial [Sphingobacteriales bacterium]
EVPGPGDPDGSGYAMLRLNQGQGTISYELSVENIDPAMAAHIHIGVKGVAGPVIIALEAPTDGYSSGTITDVDPELIKAMRQDPKAYYVNVHNMAYPGGAVRGQLSK